jgi:phosphoribosyl 1,2-cyclic phosphate phosphodiesterase
LNFRDCVTPLPLNTQAHVWLSAGVGPQPGRLAIRYRRAAGKTLKFLLNNQPQLIIIDCSHEPRPQPRNHCDLNTVRAINQVIGCPRVILTHISHRFDAWMMENALPAGFEAGFDGMEIALD